ncbi:MAG: RNA polymerase sigma factor [Firmicutes bacterium]|nr:RNA polymerase sigma factor [Bacillota bacterium]
MLLMFLSLLGSDEDRKKFTELYEEYHELIESVAIKILRDQHAAEDAVQNTYKQIIDHFEKIYVVPCEKLRYWIISIVKNEALMILRKEKRVVTLEDWTIVEQAAEDVSGYNDLVALFRELPETYRAVLEMKFLLDYSSKEIAKHLNISARAVDTRVSRGRELLKKIVEREGYRP